MKQDVFKNEDFLFKTCYNSLEESFRNYQGQYSDVVKFAPDIFRLLINLYGDPKVPETSKPILNAAIAYLVSPFDAIPEGELGLYAFIDDMFLCAWTIKKLEEQIDHRVLEKNWEGEGNLTTLVDEIYNTTHLLLKDYEEKILRFAGLGEFVK
jgi:uncharacterized membrane protein YkvA (DUF1232 family)